MRFNLSFLTLAFLSLFTTVSYGFVGPSCLKIRDAIGNKPDQVLEKFGAQVCKKGCKPIIANWDKWARKNVFLPLIDQVAKDMHIPQHKKLLVELGDEVVKVVKKECVPKLGKHHLCEDPETFSEFGTCLKASLLPVVLSKVDKIMPLVAEPMCKKELAYLKKPDLWEKTIPEYLEKYSNVCSRL